MDTIISAMELCLSYIIEICIIILEAFGVVILVFTAVKCFMQWMLRHDSQIRLDLAKGSALSLGFKMGSEVLRTTIVRELEELVILGVVILLHGVLTFLIHWEIKHEVNALSEKK